MTRLLGSERWSSLSSRHASLLLNHLSRPPGLSLFCGKTCFLIIEDKSNLSGILKLLVCTSRYLGGPRQNCLGPRPTKSFEFCLLTLESHLTPRRWAHMTEEDRRASWRGSSRRCISHLIYTSVDGLEWGYLPSISMVQG